MTNLARVRLGLKRLHTGGFSWRKIGELIGETGGQAWFIAHGQARIDEERAARMLQKLPRRIFWEGPADLDALVLAYLEPRIRITGRKLGSLLGTTDRTIRKSIKRLRDDGYNIDASMRPPRGYRLDDHAIDA